MGLECYAEPYVVGRDLDDGGDPPEDRIPLTPEQQKAFMEATWFSLGKGRNPGCFAGKPYQAGFEAITQYSLYDRLTPFVLSRYVLPRLKGYLEAEGIDAVLRIGDEHGYYKFRVEDVHDLIRFVEICVEHDLSLVGWY